MTSRGHLLPLFFRRWMDTLAPRPCAVCGMRLGACEQLVCVGCNLSLPRTGYALNPYDNDMAMLFWHLAPVDKAAALFFYKAGSPTARAIYKLKYYSRPDIGYGLGQLMARELAANGFFDDINLIVPVPLSPKRKRQRGYNQSEAIAAGLAHETGVGMDARAFAERPSIGRRRISAARSGRRMWPACSAWRTPSGWSIAASCSSTMSAPREPRSRPVPVSLPKCRACASVWPHWPLPARASTTTCARSTPTG